MVVGIGYDIHRLVSGRPLMIGGIRIPFEKGLLGHSDADVLLHAVCDACLGAAGLGDIGEHFPDTDPAYEGISSRELLTRTWRMVQERGFRIGNIDATVFAQAPPDRTIQTVHEGRNCPPGGCRHCAGQYQGHDHGRAWCHRHRGEHRRPVRGPARADRSGSRGCSIVREAIQGILN